MNTLTLNSALLKKFDRLSSKVGQLYFNGVNPNDFAGAPMVAVVGTRKPTPYALAMTEKIVQDLVREGVIIISGLAFGIDIAAHKAALAAGGKTIAVLASDVDTVYPATHRTIAADITASGSLISEHDDNPQPRKEAFLHRNRIIAALSDAVLIPEAAEHSGSLNTAGHAAKMSIPVCALPGRTIDLMSAGTNGLIKSGKATMATHSADVLKLLNIQPQTTVRPLKGTNTRETAILIAIQSGIHDTTLIAQETELNTATLQTALTMLEISGHIIQNELGEWTIA